MENKINSRIALLVIQIFILILKIIDEEIANYLIVTEFIILFVLFIWLVFVVLKDIIKTWLLK